MKSNRKVNFYLPFIFGTVTYFLIWAFLSEKLIDIPKGTHQGGVISAVGVGVILIVMTIVIFGVRWQFNRRR